MKLNNQIYAFLLITLSTALTSVLAQQPLRTLSTIDAELVCICGEASSPYAERVRLIHRLPSNLTPEQLERCSAFRRPRPCAAIARLRAEADTDS